LKEGLKSTVYAPILVIAGRVIDRDSAVL